MSGGTDIRWARLFDDLEAQWEAGAREAVHAEVADRTRRERASVHLLDRLAAEPGDLTLVLVGGRRIAGRPVDLGTDFVVVADGAGRRLVRTAAVVQVTGLPRRAAGPRTMTATRRFGLGYALRAIARDRAAVVLDDVLGRSLTGTIEAVGADHLDLVEHPLDCAPRRSAARPVCVIPFAALACVSST